MSGPSRFQIETQATKALLDLLQQAEETRILFENANMALPEPLKRFLDLDASAGDRGTTPTVQISPPRRAREPGEARDDWVSIAVADASPKSLVLAILRGADGALRAKEIASRVQAVSSDVSGGTIANIGTKLDESGVIERSVHGWELIETDEAGILLDGYLWAPAASLSSQELAAHRREAILYLLSGTQVGFQATQLEEQLRNCGWVQAPVNKDQLKADLKVLAAEKKIRRRGNTKKWERVPEGASD